VVRICTRLEAGARLHDGKSDAPEPAMYDQGPWTLTVREQSPVASDHHEWSKRRATAGPAFTQRPHHGRHPSNA